MKKIFTLLSILPFAATSWGQAITINAADMPIPTMNYNIMDMSNGGALANPLPGINVVWDYGIYNGTSYTEDYTTESDTFFTNVGIDVMHPNSKSLASNFGYEVDDEIDFNASSVKVSGILVPAQTYDLSIATGNAGDQLDIPMQKYRLPATTTLIPFPCTMGTAWHTVSRRSVDFNLTITPLYTNTPGQHVYYSHRDDTVVGWGKMRVYAVSGPSIYYDVLMDKIQEYAVDSMYLSGAPADALFLASFGITQGQHSDSDCYYNFYRKTSFNYLVSMDYTTDNSYNTLDAAYSNTDNIEPSGINSLNGMKFSTLLYPNPATNEVNLKVMGGIVNMASYTVTDMAGRVVLTGTVDKGATQLHIALGNAMQKGMYVLSVADDKGSVVAREEFNVNLN